jgi:hypothetical protein
MASAIDAEQLTPFTFAGGVFDWVLIAGEEIAIQWQK